MIIDSGMHIQQPVFNEKVSNDNVPTGHNDNSNFNTFSSILMLTYFLSSFHEIMLSFMTAIQIVTFTAAFNFNTSYEVDIQTLQIPKCSKPIFNYSCSTSAEDGGTWWYFNSARGRCLQISKNTCISGQNKYRSKSDCRKACYKGKKTRKNRKSNRIEIGESSWRDICLAEMKSENCASSKSRDSRNIWHFNSSSGVCERCAFTGKSNFRNKFSDYDECRWACFNISAYWDVRNCRDCDISTSVCTKSVQSPTGLICTCKPGYDRRAKTALCLDVNECVEPLAALCHENARCLNTVGSYTCRCKKGFTGDGKVDCASIDKLTTTDRMFPLSTMSFKRCHVSTREQCNNRNLNCALEAFCLHSDDVYFCQCPDGYLGDGFVCQPSEIDKTIPKTVDLHRCTDVGLVCHRFAKCFRYGTKHFCQCSLGYFGNGTDCHMLPTNQAVMIEMVYCSRNAVQCSLFADCYHLSPSSYLCKCKEGYVGDGNKCYKSLVSKILPLSTTLAPGGTAYTTDIKHCIVNSQNCDKYASCFVLDGSFFCQCNPGYAGNGLSCTTDRNSCLEPFDNRYKEQCGSYGFQKWFYFNHQFRRCKMFWFGKCSQNNFGRNIFSDELTCNDICENQIKFNVDYTTTIGQLVRSASYGKPATTATIAPSTTTASVEKNQCRQPCQPGYCSRTTVMYYFNEQLGRCEPFVYSGCGGNENRFPSMAFCETVCTSPQLLDVDEICLLPLNVGFGKGDKKCESNSRTAFYFDPYLSQCSPFVYLGCGGNSNRFATVADCNSRCTRINVFKYIMENHNLRDCFDPMSEGNCEYINNSPRIRFYYDWASRECQPFHYNGCGGNNNRFGEKEICESVCSGLHKPKSKICVHWPDSGLCHEKSNNWYFDLKSGQCHEFQWGCGGNSNRFPSKSKCEEICVM